VGGLYEWWWSWWWWWCGEFVERKGEGEGIGRRGEFMEGV